MQGVQFPLKADMSHWLHIAWITAFLISGHLTSKTRRQRKLVPVVIILAQAP